MNVSKEIVGDIEDLVGCYRKQSIPSETLESISFKRSQLLSWYRENRRQLPWRGDNTHLSPSPYGTWISEIMLQQTRVETVIEYWKRWMEAFPTLESLASSSPDDVNKLWAGLGYYRRAQQLLKGAQFVMKEFSGIIPSSVDELLKIPGIGPYTAGAIASIAFNKPAPLVDGNVIRVFSRLYGITAEIGGAGGVMEKICWSLAGKLVDPVDPGAFNQSLMELGATVCKPTSPLCDICPVRGVCTAKALVDHKLNQLSNDSLSDLPSEVTIFPRKVAKKKPLEVILSVCVLIFSSGVGTESKYLFCRRPAKGLLANQWEFPSVVLSETQPSSGNATEDGDDNDDEVAAAEQKRYSESELWSPLEEYLQSKFDITLPTGTDDDVSSKVDYSRLLTEPILHIFSHQRHTMHITVKHVSSDIIASSSNECSGGKWMSADEITSEGITSGCKKILQEVIKCFTSAATTTAATGVAKGSKKRKVDVKEEPVLVVEVKEELPKPVFANVFEKMLNGARNSSSSSGTKKEVTKKKSKSA